MNTVTLPQSSSTDYDYTPVLAFIRLSLYGELLANGVARCWAWYDLRSYFDMRHAIPLLPIGSFQLYEELDLATLEPSGNGPSQELWIDSVDAMNIYSALVTCFKQRYTGHAARSLHQLIYRAIGATPITDSLNIFNYNSSIAGELKK